MIQNFQSYMNSNFTASEFWDSMIYAVADDDRADVTKTIAIDCCCD